MFFLPCLKSGLVGTGRLPYDLPPVSGYSLWLAPESSIYQDTASSVSASSQNDIVRTWQDLSGFSNHAIKTGSGGPPGDVYYSTSSLNGYRLLYFGHDPAQVFGQQNRTGLLTPSVNLGSDGFTMFLVGCFISPPSPEIAETYGTFWSLNPPEFIIRQNNSTRQIVTYHNSNGVGLTDTITVGFNTFKVWAYRFDASLDEQRLWRSGSSVANATDTGATVTGKMSIGYRHDDGISSHLVGMIAEILVYPGGLSDSDVGLVNTYLGVKYAL